MIKKQETKKIKDEKIEKKLLECEKIKQEYLTGWQRARADFLNYKKDGEKRTQELLKFAVLPFIIDFIDILDSFEIAEGEIPIKIKADLHIKGLLQIENQFKKFLEKNDVKEIDVLNKEFNPSTSEAVAEIEKKDVEQGIVVEVSQKGYSFNDMVIRPAKVKIAK